MFGKSIELERKELFARIETAKEKALGFCDQLRTEKGWRYTVNHDPDSHPAGLLYGTWSCAYIKKLLLGDAWSDDAEIEAIKRILLSYRRKDGTFLPDVLLKIKPPKSYEYLIMHCSNYASGALSMLDQDFDFQSAFFDKFLDAEYLDRWLKQRSFSRPWEESNNIVNVASYFAMCNDAGDCQGRERLYQMLEWHNEYQSPKTGGFDNFSSASRKNIRQSMAGAVHNFHVHHYLGEPIRFEELIATNVIGFLFEGPLTACLSIDFVELACHTLQYVENKGEVVSSLLCHLDSLLNYQNEDGGWFEAAACGRPTSANGMRETQASSCSYSTWFRLVSIGMIQETCLDNSNNWNFRNTLGMGAFFGKQPSGNQDLPLVISNVAKRKFLRKSLGGRAKERAIELVAKLM